MGRRRLFNLAAGLSLLVCLAAGAASLRSHFAADHLAWRGERVAVAVINTRGRVVGWRIDWGPGGARGPVRRFRYQAWNPLNDPLAYMPYPVQEIYSPVAGFGVGAGIVPAARAGDPAPSAGYLALPWWPVILLSAVLPARWVAAHSRCRRWRRQGKCVACGYDLRHSRERCPECGAAADAPDARSSSAAERRETVAHDASRGETAAQPVKRSL